MPSLGSQAHTWVLPFCPVITSAINIVGQGRHNTILHAQRNGRLFTIEGGRLVLRRLTLTRGAIDTDQSASGGVRHFWSRHVTDRALRDNQERRFGRLTRWRCGRRRNSCHGWQTDSRRCSPV